jgi:phosphate transport system ATP-binding protein
MKSVSKAISIFQFNFWYGDFQALKNITIDVDSNHITSLIGPSGCGKSTLLKCLNRINERQSNVRATGSMQIFGQDIYHPQSSTYEIRKNVGMVFQKPNPLPLSVSDNILFGLKTHNPKGSLKKSQMEEMVEMSLKKVNMWEELKDRLSAPALGLSLEKQQKLCIARLLPLKPHIILLDEPCSALDPQGTQAVEELIRELKKDYTIVIVTHSMAQAKRISDETIFMYMGELIEHGKTDQVFNQPKLEQTLHYIEGRFG